jgi:hypothetical protein
MEHQKKRWNEQAAENTKLFLDPPALRYPFGGTKMISKTKKFEKINERLKKAA